MSDQVDTFMLDGALRKPDVFQDSKGKTIYPLWVKGAGLKVSYDVQLEFSVPITPEIVESLKTSFTEMIDLIVDGLKKGTI